MSEPSEVTALLADVRNGQPEAFEKLIPLVYHDLRRLAAFYMSAQPPDHTLQPTALVHEVYLRLSGREISDWQDRDHFFASAAQVMRNLLVDHARGRQRAKRGGGGQRVLLEDAIPLATFDPEGLLTLDDALTRLAQLDARASRVVELRCFVGLSLEETAAALGISERTVKRDWNLAKTWLQAELQKSKT
jgi:RNA polymerase sigma-70 factor (ECF subfamily)